MRRKTTGRSDEGEREREDTVMQGKEVKGNLI